MKPSDFQKTVQCRFESCLKKVVRQCRERLLQGIETVVRDKEISIQRIARCPC